jgi:hypothetical protein
MDPRCTPVTPTTLSACGTSPPTKRSTCLVQNGFCQPRSASAVASA